MTYEIIQKDRYTYLKLHEPINSSELSDCISLIKDLCSINKNKNILVDIRECEKFSDLICIFYETTKFVQINRITFFIEEYYDHINCSKVMKILSKIKLAKMDVFINKNELKKWISNLNIIPN